MRVSKLSLAGFCRTFLLSLILMLCLQGCKSKKPRLVEATNGIGITMVAIPAGKFMMGEASVSSVSGQTNTAYPAHEVNVSAFELAKTEVTVAQYKKFLAAAGREGLRQLNDTDFLKYNSSSEDAAVVNLNPKNIRDFIAWLNQLEGGGYRLPTEAEWEYACRAGNNDAYCGGNKVDEVAWHGGNSENKAHPVGQKKANAFGIYDMSGNAEEPVADCWHSDYQGAPTDGGAWEADDQSCKFFVVRGGSWWAAEGGARATSRDSKSTDRFYHPSLGIRLARAR